MTSTFSHVSLEFVVMRAWLDGHEFDLRDLAEFLLSGDTKVVRDGDAYYLTSTDVDNRADGVSIEQAAAVVLSRLNGIGRLLNPSFRPVRLAGRYGDGEGDHTVVAAAADHVRAREDAKVLVVKAAGDEAPTPLTLGPRYAKLATTVPDIADALTVLGQAHPLGWVELYKVFEIVRDNVKPNCIETLGWATRKETSAFTASANRADVSGSTARHARNGGDPPRHRMTEDEGAQFITRLVTAWLRSLE